MKKALYLVLKNVEKAYETLEELKNKGYNGTLVGSNSLRHTLQSFPEEHHFLNLRHISDINNSESILCIFVWEENIIEEIKEEIRKYTNNFKDIKGFMYSTTLDDYEGSN